MTLYQGSQLFFIQEAFEVEEPPMIIEEPKQTEEEKRRDKRIALVKMIGKKIL